MAFYQFKKEQYIDASPEEVWTFISNPSNLARITPEDMGFVITSGNLPEKIYPGMIISYKVRPVARIPVTWVTEITQVLENRYFVDEQRSGPYAMWHHQHIIEPSGSGTLMRDIVSYKPPFGFLGAIANKLIINRRLEGIFNYRTVVLEKLFVKSGSALK